MTPTLIMTRPTAQSESFAAKVVAEWDRPLRIIHSPLIKIVPLDAKAGRPDAVIFTSANGVLAVEGLGLPKGLTAWCVGPRTAGMAQAAGFAPIVGPGDADGLVAALISAHPKGALAHIRGNHARGDVGTRLNDAGIICHDVVAYDQMALALTDVAQSTLAASEPVLFPLFSPRTAAILGGQGPFTAPVEVIALSAAVKDAVPEGITKSITTAQKPESPAMLTAILEVLRMLNGRS